MSDKACITCANRPFCLRVAGAMQRYYTDCGDYYETVRVGKTLNFASDCDRYEAKEEEKC